MPRRILAQTKQYETLRDKRSNKIVILELCVTFVVYLKANLESCTEKELSPDSIVLDHY